MPPNPRSSEPVRLSVRGRFGSGSFPERPAVVPTATHPLGKGRGRAFPRGLGRWGRQHESRFLSTFDGAWRSRYGAVIAGVDEAGRGPWAGPVVAAAVILPSDCVIAGLRDSKQLTPPARAELADIIQRSALTFGIGVVEAGSVDSLNILQATFYAMRAALAQLLQPPQLVLVDGWPIPGLSLDQAGIVQGDTLSASIAAASILAKVMRDHLMNRWDAQFPEYGFRRHKGYGTVGHRTALAHYGPSPIHRRSFAPIRQLMPSSGRSV